VDVDLIGWVGVGLGGAYGCRCGILYAPIVRNLSTGGLFLVVCLQGFAMCP